VEYRPDFFFEEVDFFASEVLDWRLLAEGRQHGEKDSKAGQSELRTKQAHREISLENLEGGATRPAEPLPQEARRLLGKRNKLRRVSSLVVPPSGHWKARPKLNRSSLAARNPRKATQLCPSRKTQT
jgi:hypothetical protein